MASLVSIVICTYNRCNTLEKTLQSVCQISYKPHEVIVVDNNSTDNTAEIVKKYPVKYLLEKSQGVSFARNAGVNAAKGQFIGFIDDDELVNPDWINEIIKGFDLDEKVAAVTGPVIPQYEVNVPSWLPNTFHGSDSGLELRLLLDKEVISTGNSISKAEIAKTTLFKTNLGRIKNNLVSGEDTDFCRQIYDKGFKGAYSPKAIVYHIIPGTVYSKMVYEEILC